MEIVNATRMNLLLKREELNSATLGIELLRDKRDVLLLEFFSVLRPLIELKERLDAQSYEAALSLFLALCWEGKEKLISASFIRPEPKGFKISYKNLLGLKIPQIVIEPEGDESSEDFIFSNTELIIQETREKFLIFLNLALRILPEELKLKLLGQEIKNTTRKVNSLERYVIPKLHTQIKFIREALEEREREDIFRLKRLKRHLAR